MMPVQSVLIAEPDYGTIDNLSCTLFGHIDNIAIVTCASAEELSQKVERFSYNTIALNPVFLPTYRSIRKKQDQLLAPLLVMVYQKDLTVAQAALDGDVFDLILKPLLPHEATQTVRLALWQNRLLKLLASSDRTVARFQQHIEVFPHDAKVQEQWVRDRDAFNRTFQALQSSIELLAHIDDDKILFDLADLVEHRARQQALDRLLRLL